MQLWFVLTAGALFLLLPCSLNSVPRQALRLGWDLRVGRFLQAVLALLAVSLAVTPLLLQWQGFERIAGLLGAAAAGIAYARSTSPPGWPEEGAAPPPRLLRLALLGAIWGAVATALLLAAGLIPGNAALLAHLALWAFSSAGLLLCLVQVGAVLAHYRALKSTGGGGPQTSTLLAQDFFLTLCIAATLALTLVSYFASLYLVRGDESSYPVKAAVAGSCMTVLLALAGLRYFVGIRGYHLQTLLALAGGLALVALGWVVSG